MTAAVGLIAALNKLSSDLLGERETIYVSLLLSVAPQLYYAFFGVVFHAALRLLGGQRRLRTTVGLALYAGGGPASIALLMAMAVSLPLKLTGRMTEPGLAHASLPAWLRVSLMVFISALMTSFFILLGLSAKGAHRLKGWRITVAILLALFVSALILGLIGDVVPGVLAPRLIIRDGRLMPQW